MKTHEPLFPEEEAPGVKGHLLPYLEPDSPLRLNLPEPGATHPSMRGWLGYFHTFGLAEASGNQVLRLKLTKGLKRPGKRCHQ